MLIFNHIGTQGMKVGRREGGDNKRIKTKKV
jgi:hypothetical protein